MQELFIVGGVHKGAAGLGTHKKLSGSDEQDLHPVCTFRNPRSDDVGFYRLQARRVQVELVAA
jgi:hypothetical protein